MSITANFTSRRFEIDQLEDSIIRHCHRINAATYDLLIDLRDFDQRAGFLRSGFENRSCFGASLDVGFAKCISAHDFGGF